MDHSADAVLRDRVDQVTRSIAERLIYCGDNARDSGNFHSAGTLYHEALRITPDNAAIRIQCGHMLKETGDLWTAELHYLAARELTPDDADLALQLGHFYKVAGRLGEAEQAYRRASELQPGWPEALLETAALETRRGEASSISAEPGMDRALNGLLPELLARKPYQRLRTHVDSLRVHRLGSRSERSRWGTRPALRGVEAIRGFCIASSPVSEMRVMLDDALAHTETLRSFPFEGAVGTQRKYVFNAWIDFSAVPAGLHMIELRFPQADGKMQRHRQSVVIASALSEKHHPTSDGIVEVPSGTLSPVTIINARPSVVRSAQRTLLDGPIRRILVQRTDQLGDLVTSIPAVHRIREIFPNAELVGLLTAANADLARNLGLFDEIVLAEFPDDWAERRRIMTAADQEELRAKLIPFAFDIAIDMAESSVSRPLLQLSGAKFLYGFYDRDWPWLDGGFEGNSHDRKNGLEIAAQSTKVLGLIERLGATFNSRAKVIRRTDLDRGVLEIYGLAASDKFAVLHTGARIPFSRWPYYNELSAMILERTGLKVLLFNEVALAQAEIPATLAANERFRLIDGRLPFDHFDALLSFATVFVGNDSGPKHLASLRGTATVSIHSSRINWNEWGQEITGCIVSRKLPCAGCAIFHDEDECGKEFACIRRITAEEVFSAMMSCLPEQSH